MAQSHRFVNMLLRPSLLSLLFLQWFTLLSVPTYAKKVSGKFRLSGEKSEIVLTSFAVVPTGGQLTVNFTSGTTMYEQDQNLRLHLFRDVEWPQFQKALTCSDKVLVARQSNTVSFEYRSGQWRTKPIEMEIVNSDSNSKATSRPHCTFDDFSLITIGTHD